MAITATCTFCERSVTLGVENQWFDSNGNYRCGEGPHIGWHHTPKGSTISRESAPFPETPAARELLSPTAEDNPRVPPRASASSSAHGQAYVGVHRIGESGTTIFVVMEDRAAFDLIDLPLYDHGKKPNGGHVITKSIDEKRQHIIFQFWIIKPK
jgi:hypothetical protein